MLAGILHSGFLLLVFLQPEKKPSAHLCNATKTAFPVISLFRVVQVVLRGRGAERGNSRATLFHTKGYSYPLVVLFSFLKDLLIEQATLYGRPQYRVAVFYSSLS